MLTEDRKPKAELEVIAQIAPGDDPSQQRTEGKDHDATTMETGGRDRRGEISNGASQAAGVAASGVTSARAATETISRLGHSSAKIGEVIRLITSIAEQTNLLALNATIEAARAGELGKGFAVVAGEVKDLAQATAQATDDISGMVQAIQQDTNAAIIAIDQITDIISAVNEHSTTIAAAVEEQTATTTEMSRNIVEAATGSGQIAANITGVASATRETASGVAESRQTAEQLAHMSHDLQRYARLPGYDPSAADIVVAPLPDPSQPQLPLSPLPATPPQPPTKSLIQNDTHIVQVARYIDDFFGYDQ